MVIGAGETVKFALAAGLEADVTIFRMDLNFLPEGSVSFADKAYTDYDCAHLPEEASGLHLKPTARRTPRSLCWRGRSTCPSRSVNTSRRSLAG